MIMRKCYSAASHSTRQNLGLLYAAFKPLSTHCWFCTLNICLTFCRGRLTLSLCRSWRTSLMLKLPSPFLSASVKVCFSHVMTLLVQESQREGSGHLQYCAADDLTKSLYTGQERINAIDKLSPLCFKMKLKLSIDFSLIYTYMYTCNSTLVFLYM